MSVAVLGVSRKDALLGVVTGLWAAAAVAGFAAVWRYKSTPGAPEQAPASWPAAASAMLAADRPTLVLFAHPRCPCTRASLAELARLTARLEQPVRTHIVFVHPVGVQTDWLDTDLVQSARAIPGAEITDDHGEVLTRMFGSTTSGHARLYGPDGELWFSGGLTEARGHEGRSVGQESLVALINGRQAVARTTPTFGCHLQTPGENEL